MNSLYTPVVHTVQGETEADCIRQIEDKHSLNYQIVKTKKITIKKGLFNLFVVDGIEMSYVLTRFQTPQAVRDYKSSPRYPSESANSEAKFEEERKKILEQVNYKPNAEIQEVLKAVKAMGEKIDNVASPANEVHPTISKIESFMEENEFSISYTKKIIERIRKEFPIDDLNDFDLVQNAVVEWIGESISVKKPDYEARPQIIVLVGSTGVGKTTTVAKLAARYAFGEDGTGIRKNVRIITIDWYRIAAEQQIKIYGDTMRVPVSLAKNTEDISTILETHRNEDDYIIIDTTGYSPKDYENIAKMKKLLDLKNYAVSTFLCMSASTKLSDMKEIMQQYEIFGYNSTIITKFDETSHIGNIVSALSDKGKSITYLTTGQKVPNYYEEASVVRLLLELTSFKVDKNKLEEKFGKLAD